MAQWEFCVDCGKSILDDSEFCPYCGIKHPVFTEEQAKDVLLHFVRAKGYEGNITFGGVHAVRMLGVFGFYVIILLYPRSKCWVYQNGKVVNPEGPYDSLPWE